MNRSEFLNHTLILSCAVICAGLAGAVAFVIESRLNQHSQNQNTQMAQSERPIRAEMIPPQSSASLSYLAQSEPSPPATSGITIPKAQDGHFWIEASINQKAVRFLVDTGASNVALTLDDARRLGFDPQGLNFNRTVTTASGQIKAAVITLPFIDVRTSRITNVEAMVLKEGLSTSLLGMSYLGRLSKIEATPTAMVLHP